MRFCHSIEMEHLLLWRHILCIHDEQILVVKLTFVFIVLFVKSMHSVLQSIWSPCVLLILCMGLIATAFGKVVWSSTFHMSDMLSLQQDMPFYLLCVETHPHNCSMSLTHVFFLCDFFAYISILYLFYAQLFALVACDPFHFFLCQLLVFLIFQDSLLDLVNLSMLYLYHLKPFFSLLLSCKFELYAIKAFYPYQQTPSIWQDR